MHGKFRYEVCDLKGTGIFSLQTEPIHWNQCSYIQAHIIIIAYPQLSIMQSTTGSQIGQGSTIVVGGPRLYFVPCLDSLGSQHKP